MVGRASTLACLAIVATLRAQAAAPSTQLYACQKGQCVPYFRGLPLVRCEQTCTPAPSANYTCQGGQCVVSGRGLPKKECTQVCGGPGPAPGGKTIVDLAVATPDLSTLVTALKAGGLVGTLSGQGPFTVFAPTNEAFTALPNGVLANLLKPENKAQLADVLTYHVVSGAVFAKDLKDGERIKTVEGKSLVVRLSGSDVFINSAKVTTPDVNASNGVVHIIDSVLLPAGPAPPPAPPGPAPGPGPTGCTKAGCFFSFTNKAARLPPPFPPAKNGGRCGEVDAALRMPNDIWNDPKTVAAYVKATQELYAAPGFFASGFELLQKPCDHNPEKWARNGTQQIEWDGNSESKTGFAKFCQSRCDCSVKPGRVDSCTDKPDRPPYFCSLCGPTLNKPIDVQFYYPRAAVIASDIEASNGIVHIVNKVLLPK